MNQEARKIRLANTYIKYLEKFGNFVFGHVWEISKKNENNNLDKNNLIEFELPSYEKNIIKEPNMIKIFIFYTYDDGYFRPKECENNIFSFKEWKPNQNEFDRKILTIQIDKSTSINM